MRKSNTMKILRSLVSLAILAGWNYPLLAQEPECFIQNSKGTKVDLAHICGKNSVPVALPKSNSPQSPQFITIPIKNRRGNTPVIEVIFNGNQTFDMILDTGATGTVITEQMAAALKVRPFTSIKAQVADGSFVVFPVGLVESIGVNGATVNRIPVAIAPQIRLGLLGNDFLNSYDVKIKRETIELYQRN
ncbi:MAG: retroviral-like aspartic protease family protein [Cyanobacteria bacterium KgW148]|nr:retroviral-like aspartic protease family protein [Cyanobacteria bacterium KgW148]